MRLPLFILVALSLTLRVYAQTPCFARITASPREGSSWVSGSTTYQIYDITATNAGSCTLLRVVGYFSGTDGTITEGWNYDISSGLITGYGDELPPGAVFMGAGFITANSSAVTLALDRPGCDTTCGATPSTTSSPTATPTPTLNPSPTPTGSGEGTPSACTVTLTQRITTDEEGLNTYNITITNIGGDTVVTPVFFINLVEGFNLGIVSTSGLVTYASTVAGQILVSLPPNTPIAAGATYTAASYVTNNTVTALRLSSCVSDSTPADSSASSSSDASSDSDSPAEASTTTTPTPTGGCAVTPTVARDGYAWVDSEGRNTSVYRLTLTNVGPCALTDYVTSFALGGGEILSSWNLESARGGYLVSGYGGTLAAGASYSGAGFILARPQESVGDVYATPYGANCAC